MAVECILRLRSNDCDLEEISDIFSNYSYPEKMFGEPRTSFSGRDMTSRDLVKFYH